MKKYFQNIKHQKYDCDFNSIITGTVKKTLILPSCKWVSSTNFESVLFSSEPTMAYF